MSVRIGDHGRTTETAKLLQAQASTADKVRKPAAEKSSRELCSDIPVVKLELSKEGKESVKKQVRCRQNRYDPGTFYADPESQIAEVRRAFKEEQEQRAENEAFLEGMEEDAMTALRDAVMQYVRGSLSDISKMFGKLDC